MNPTRSFAGWVAAAVICAGCGRPATMAPVYTVHDFDAAANPFVDLADTVSQAQSHGKRILLEVGGRW